MPEPEAPITISAAIGQQASYSVSWQNPFLTPVKAEVQLRGSSGANDNPRSSGFELLGRKQQSVVAVAPGASLQLTIAYTARSMEESSAELGIVVREDDANAAPSQITWQYPFKVCHQQYPSHSHQASWSFIS